MHPNPVYRGTARQIACDFVAERGFGTLSVNGSKGPLVSHVPFVPGDGMAILDAHLVRSNPIAALLRGGPVSAVIAVTGPDAYISPDWYGIKDQVPTWNYISVHLRGQLSLRDPDDLRAHLDALSASFERRLAPKPVWTTAKMDADALARMMRMILPVRLTVEAIDSTFKLGQNKPATARIGAADGLGAIGQETAQLAALMREQSPDDGGKA